MDALLLEDVAKFQVRQLPKPVPKENEVLIRIGAVGLCGTDWHIFRGLANLNLDQRGQPIPLRQRPQVLGHEFCGRIETVGQKVRKCKPGDHVVVDQVLNCWSQGRFPRCEYCESGDSHQCHFGQELGITGPPGAFADYITVPETNVVALPSDMPFARGALIEPLGCILHASDRMEKAQNRYTFEGQRRIRYVLIVGAGPAGLLFLQYLRNIKRFDGEVFVAEMRESKLALARKLGGTPLDVRKVDPVTEIERRTRGERVHYLIEATGAGTVFDWMPSVIRHQSTVLLYGAGHSGRDVGCLTPLQISEINLVTTCGASGTLDADGTPTIYRRSMEYVRDGKVDTESLLTHRYTELSQLQGAFSEDVQRNDFIKGVFVRKQTA